VLILGFGALQFFFADRAKDFLGEDVFFADAARSIVEHGFYGINGYAETNQPPGLPSILALLSIVGGCSHTVFLRAMAVFSTLGFLASYELLRRQVPRVVAGAICLLLISSQIHFELVTQGVWPSYPYFFTTMSALLVTVKLDKAARISSRIWLGALLTVFIVASLMFASAGIALLGAIVASVCVIFFRDRRLAFARLRTYFAVFLIGIVAEGLWMSQNRFAASSGTAASEWPVAGFPQSYLSQLKVKSGNYPELGMATQRDIPVRVLKNAYESSNLLSRVLLRCPIYVAWTSIVTFGVLILIALGWCNSVWPTGGGLQDWYFAGYEFIYLLWPWNTEPRFLLPVAPFACLYMWRGGKTLVFLAKNRPRVLGVVWFPVAVLLTISAWLWMHGSWITGGLPHAGFQDEISFAFWLLSAILAAWMAWAGRGWLGSASTVWRTYAMSIGALRIDVLRILQLLAVVIVTALIGAGVRMQLEIGRANVDLKSATNRLPPDVEAGEWIRSHTDTNAVVMARHVPTVYHYANRKLVWFPPSSDPHLLMAGIQKHKIDFVIVVRRENSYYLPSDDDSFAPLLVAYPKAFRLVHETPQFRIFEADWKASPAL
jgi:hypothetical protein